MRSTTSTLKTDVISAMCGILILLPIVSTNTIPNRCRTTRQDKKCRQLHGPNYWDYDEECKTPKEICPNMYTYYDRCDNSKPCKPCDRQWWNPDYQLTCTKRRVSPELIPKTQEKEMSTTISSNHEATTSTVKFTSTVPAATGSTAADDIRPASPALPYGYEETVDTTLVPLSGDGGVIFSENDRNQKRVVDSSLLNLVAIVSVVVLLFASAGVVYGIVLYQIEKYVKEP